MKEFLLYLVKLYFLIGLFDALVIYFFNKKEMTVSIFILAIFLWPKMMYYTLKQNVSNR